MTKKPKIERKKDSFDWKHMRVEALFAFLDRNKEWNKEFQEREYMRCLAGCVSGHDRLVRFLHLNVNTQSGPDMDELKPFWEALHRATAEQTSSMSSFTEYLTQQAEEVARRKGEALARRRPVSGKWEALFRALNAHPGWGIKTTALFVKATIKLHRGRMALHFWPDATPALAPFLESKPFLPVDRVILCILRELGHACPRIDNVNRGMRREYSAEQMLTWDDLWFWGFFTQTGGGDERILGWNSGKFWSQLSSAKNHEAELKALGGEFVQLLGALHPRPEAPHRILAVEMP
ncbi:MULTISPECIES: hypothetical protein [unclassified Variovorax]|uniref:hypothetical protein n=1 Tax=unclassified Variovorax TaxID=663243 RepID=UPI0008AD02E7|nr:MULTISPECIES: hypothetical protein [unclassified Variovorax]SEK14919.1 hypothetical protein SAMN05518853_1167 [Variovorax sp. OK202]SFE06230.1 hypothetical protein SAMN05444746_1167 [Variovorax sp. OK212]